VEEKRERGGVSGGEKERKRKEAEAGGEMVGRRGRGGGGTSGRQGSARWLKGRGTGRESGTKGLRHKRGGVKEARKKTREAERKMGVNSGEGRKRRKVRARRKRRENRKKRWQKEV
jgi:hypothetical protein